MAYTVLTDQSFYAPWPLFGSKLSNQWEELRHNMEVLRSVATNLIADIDVNDRKNGILTGFDFGEENFSNKFRVLWEKDTNEFQFLCNEGTEAVPIWDIAFYVDCEERSLVFRRNAVFENDLSVVGTFYGGATGGGGISSITFKESEAGGASFSSDTLIVDSDYFYLTSSGGLTPKPILSFSHPIDEKSITVPYPNRNEEIGFWRTTYPITVEKAYTYLQSSDGGFYPSIKWNVRYAESRFAAGTQLITGGRWLDFYPGTNEETISSFDNPNIPANKTVWLETLDLGEGDNIEEEFHLTLHFRET